MFSIPDGSMNIESGGNKKKSPTGQMPKIFIMGNILYAVAFVLIIFWIIGYFAYHAGTFIHLLLVLAIMSFLASAVTGKRRIR